MATFTPEEIEFIKERGNDYCRRVWLGLYEGESVNFTDEQSVKDFMSDKYEKKRYYLESPPSNAPVTNGNSSVKSKVKAKLASSNMGVATPLISIAPQSTKASNNNNVNVAKIVGNAPANGNTVKLPRPVNNFSQQMGNKLPAPAAVPTPAPVPE